MKKIILSLAVVFAMSSFTTVDTNTSIEKVNVEKVALKQIDPEQDCRDEVEFVITYSYLFGDATLQELADLEIDLLIACFDKNL